MTLTGSQLHTFSGLGTALVTAVAGVAVWWADSEAAAAKPPIDPFADMQVIHAALAQKALNRAQLVHSVKAGGHLGVALVQQRAPPHGKPVAAAEPELHFAAVHGHAGHVERPGHVLGAGFL